MLPLDPPSSDELLWHEPCDDMASSCFVLSVDALAYSREKLSRFFVAVCKNNTTGMKYNTSK
jgi:hypothetical protein